MPLKTPLSFLSTTLSLMLLGASLQALPKELDNDGSAKRQKTAHEVDPSAAREASAPSSSSVLPDVIEPVLPSSEQTEINTCDLSGAIPPLCDHLRTLLNHTNALAQSEEKFSTANIAIVNEIALTMSKLQRANNLNAEAKVLLALNKKNSSNQDGMAVLKAAACLFRSAQAFSHKIELSQAAQETDSDKVIHLKIGRAITKFITADKLFTKAADLFEKGTIDEFNQDGVAVSKAAACICNSAYASAAQVKLLGMQNMESNPAIRELIKNAFQGYAQASDLFAQAFELFKKEGIPQSYHYGQDFTHLFASATEALALAQESEFQISILKEKALKGASKSLNNE